MVALKAAELAVQESEVAAPPLVLVEPVVTVSDPTIGPAPDGGRQRWVPGQLGPTLLKH